MQLEANELHLAERTAARVAARWRSIEVEDLTSELYLWLLDNLPAVERYRATSDGIRKLSVALRRAANHYCVREKTVKNGGVLNHSHAYTVEVIERALPFIFDPSPMSTVHSHPVTSVPIMSSSAPENFNLAVTILADISSVFHGQPREIQEVLAWRFRDDLTFAEIGRLSGMNKASAQKRVKRAVKRIHDALGGE
jgi:DNA-directed RNA polymerase specialized sigma24 family protein